ncbi:MAG TPA: hypothetical protein P5114_11030 [Hyphomicrobiaceae bacterium]|nr:hypothetical protein [Hyphomicrobiaceae bacterium]
MAFLCAPKIEPPRADTLKIERATLNICRDCDEINQSMARARLLDVQIAGAGKPLFIVPNMHG